MNYSSNIILIDTAAGQACIADSSDSTLINVTYLKGDGVTSDPEPRFRSVTIGKLDTLCQDIYYKQQR